MTTLSSSSSASSPVIMSSAVVMAAVAAAATTATAYFFLQQMNRSKEGDAIAGFPSPPNAHWLFGHLILLNGGEQGFVYGYPQVYSKHADPEGRGSFWFFTAPAVSLLQGKDVKTVLAASSYRKNMSIVSVHTEQFLGEKALVNLMGKEWRLYRSAVHKSFSPNAIRQSQHIIYHVGDLLADTLLKSDLVAPPTTQILPLMKMATMDVFGLAALDVDFGCCANLELSLVAKSFDFLTAEYTRRLRTPWDPFSFTYHVPTPANRKYQQQKSIIRTFIAGQIQKAEDVIALEEAGTGTVKPADKRSSFSSSTTSDVLTNLVKAAKAEASDKDEKVSGDALGDVIMTLLFGGYDTTSITLTYALYLLAKHPKYEQACLEEVEAVLGKATAEIDFARTMDIGPDQLPFTRAVIMETLRLYPPAPVTSRNMEKDLTLPNSKLVIPKDQLVLLPIWCIQRDEKNFPRPTEMIPERWTRRRQIGPKSDAASTASNISDWEERPSDDDASNSSCSIPPGNKDAFCVFAAGARNCVGRVLAMQESVTLLAMLIRKCKFELIDPEYEVKPFICAVVQQPQDGMPMKISKR